MSRHSSLHHLHPEPRQLIGRDVLVDAEVWRAMSSKSSPGVTLTTPVPILWTPLSPSSGP